MRVLAALGVLSLVAIACGSDEREGAEPTAVSQAEPSPVEQQPVALTESGGILLDDPTFPPPLVERSEITNGGPGPDGIPPLDDPTFLTAAETDGLEDREPVISLTVGSETRGYPIQVLIWHEIVNDTVDDVPVTVTYCPLCNSAFAFDRRVDDRVLDFGTSGKLYNSSLVMYDRQTRSLWAHFNGSALAGTLTGTQLETLPVQLVSWESFRTDHPEALVLSSDTGFDRDYGANPYPGYDDVNESPFLFNGRVDDRLAAKERVVGIEHNGEAVAVSLASLMDDPPIVVSVGGDDVVVYWESGVSSALEGSQVSDGRDVGTTSAYVAPPGGVDPDSVEVASLTPITHVDTFWFAWGAFQPDTALVGDS